MKKDTLNIELLEKAEAPTCGEFWSGVGVGIGIVGGVLILT